MFLISIFRSANVTLWTSYVLRSNFSILRCEQQFQQVLQSSSKQNGLVLKHMASSFYFQVNFLILALTTFLLTPNQRYIPGLLNLVKIDLSGQDFTCIPLEFASMTNLTCLTLDDNKIQRVPILFPSVDLWLIFNSDSRIDLHLFDKFEHVISKGEQPYKPSGIVRKFDEFGGRQLLHQSTQNPPPVLC